jgi:ATP-dependent Clp protease ATP-binding subunit ClpC
MFEKFTEGAVKVIMLAQEESRRTGHNYVGSEQLVLGLLGQRHGIAGRALAKQKLTLKLYRSALYKSVGRGSGFVASEIPFTPRAKRLLEVAIHEAKDNHVNYVGTEHLLLAILNDGICMGYTTLSKMGINLVTLRQDILKLIEEQQEIIGADGENPNDLYGEDPDQIKRWREELESKPWFSSVSEKRKKKPSEALLRAAAAYRRGTKKHEIKDFSENLTQKAQDQSLDPVIGRDKEIVSLIKVLARRRKNNPVLVGEAGVGKTACAEGLAMLMKSPKCPDFLQKHVIYNLDMGKILAGTKYRGEFEERFNSILQEAQEHGKSILVIDEIHTIVGAGAAEGAVDAANLLKPALARGALKIIGATTLDEYRKHIEKDPALERRFHPIIVEEPSVETTIDILKGVKSYYQSHHSVLYTDQALEAAASLSKRFVLDRKLPDKAIDIIDETGSEVRTRNRDLPRGLEKLLIELQATLDDGQKAIENHDFALAKLMYEHELEVRGHIRVVKSALKNKKIFEEHTIDNYDKVLEKDITGVISDWTGIPVTKINQSELDRLKKMENTLHNRLIGQHHAIVAVSKAVRRSRTGIQDPKRPIASFLFAGPTGVGKTELTKALAEYIFDSEKNMIRFDMSEFMEKHTASKLIGSPPGYVGHDEGGQLTDAVRRQPYSIILFDEVEKAHPDIFNLFLQILDDGQLTDSKGKLSDFKNCIIIMTTNLGSKVIESHSPILPEKDKKPFGFHKESWEWDEDENLLLKELKKIELEFNLDGTFTIKPPVKPEITEADEEKFEEITKLVTEELKKFFRPEFLNRIDDTIVFNHLSKHDIWEICGVMLKNLAKRLESQGVTIEIDEAVRFYLAQEGYNPVYGARPLRRAIIKLLEDELASACLDHPLERGTHIIVQQQLQPNPMVHTKYFDDIYTNNILITFDQTKVQSNLEAEREKMVNN